MIRDQATELRELVKRANTGSPAAAPSVLLAVAGGGHHCGTTTIATAVARGLADHGARVVLVDADLQSAGLAAQLDLQPQGTILDVLIHQRGIHEILLPAAGGIQVAAGCHVDAEELEPVLAGSRRLVSQLMGLGRYTEAVVVDVGNHPSALTQQLLAAAHHIVLVSTPREACLMDAYAQLKSSRGMAETVPHVHVVVNQVESAQQASAVHQGLEQSAQRFLGLTVALLGAIPAGDSRDVDAALRDGLTGQRGPEVAGLAQLGAALYPTLDGGRRRPWPRPNIKSKAVPTAEAANPAWGGQRKT